MFQTIHKLTEQLAADLAQHAGPGELRHFARDRKVVVNIDFGGDPVDISQAHRDRDRRIALTLGVSTFALDLGHVIHIVALQERGLTLVRRSNRTHFDLHPAAVLVALDFLKLRAR